MYWWKQKRKWLEPVKYIYFLNFKIVLTVTRHASQGMLSKMENETGWNKK